LRIAPNTYSAGLSLSLGIVRFMKLQHIEHHAPVLFCQIGRQLGPVICDLPWGLWRNWRLAGRREPGDGQLARRRFLLRLLAIGPRRVLADQPLDVVRDQLVTLDSGMIGNSLAILDEDVACAVQRDLSCARFQCGTLLGPTNRGCDCHNRFPVRGSGHAPGKSYFITLDIWVLPCPLGLSATQVRDEDALLIR
jgi:hypothetical protein